MGHKEDKEMGQKAKRVVSLIEGIKDSNAYENITNTISFAFRHLSDAIDDARGAVMRLSNDGYDNLDLWNLGDREADHIAVVIRHLARAYRKQGMITVSEMEEMERHATILASRDEALDTLGMARLLHPFSDYRIIAEDLPAAADVVADEALEKAQEDVRETFLSSWEWFGATFLTEEYMEPAPRMSPFRAIDKASGGVAWIDYSDYPSYELHRVSSMLRDFLNGNIGYPDGYAHSEASLLLHDGKWRDSTALWQMFVRKDVRTKSHRHETEHGVVYSSPTNGECGEDFAAWSDDISYVADVFDEWRKMLKYGYPNDVGTVRDYVRAEFLRCWKWMGLNSSALWW